MTEIGVQLPEIGVQLRPKPVFNFLRNRCSTSPEKPTSRSGVLPVLPDDIPDADVPALLEDIERRVEALPGALAPDRVQPAAPAPVDPPGRLPQPAGKLDGQPAGFDAREPDRGQTTALAPPDPPGRFPQSG